MAVLATHRTVADRLEKLRAASQKAFQNLRTASRDAIAFSNERIAPLAFWVSTATKQFTAKAWVAVSHAGISALEKLHTLQRESKEELQKLRATSHDALVHANGKISHFGSQISTAARQLATPFQKAYHSLVTAGQNVINKPRTIREARRASQTELLELLADSPDAIVVTDRDRRLVAANSIALDLFGISEHNLRNFTMDAFLAQDPFPDVEANPPAFRHREDRQCKCKIRRLDGSLQVAECVLVDHGLPREHVYKFINAAPYRVTPQVASRKYSVPPVERCRGGPS
jgi:PAS domain-containing protein